MRKNEGNSNDNDNNKQTTTTQQSNREKQVRMVWRVPPRLMDQFWAVAGVKKVLSTSTINLSTQAHFAAHQDLLGQDKLTKGIALNLLKSQVLVSNIVSYFMILLKTKF